MRPHTRPPNFVHLLRVLAVPAAIWLGMASTFVATAQMSQPQVSVVAAQLKPVGLGLELEGTVQAVKQSTVSAQTQGRVVRVWVKAGDAIKAGQVLATIDDRDAQAGLQGAQAGLTQAEAQLQNAQAQWERTRNLQQKGFVAQAALDNSQATLRSAQAAAAQARAGLTQSALAQGYAKVTAPFAGFVLNTLVESGDLATPGKPLITLYAPAPLRVVAHVPASRSGVVSKAKRIDIQLPNGGKLTPVSTTPLPAADPISQTVEWRLDLPTATDGLVPGQQVRVRWTSGTQDKLVIPQGAVLRRGELTAVYVLRESQQGSNFVLRAVRVGPDQGSGFVGVLAGLQHGERVALDPVKAGLSAAQPAPR